MPASPRDLSVSYGGFVVGSGTSRPLDGALRAERSDDRFVLEFEFWVLESTPGSLASSCTTAELAFRKPYQDLTVTGGDTQTNAVWYGFSHGAASGFDAQPSIRKVGEQRGDSAYSRRYAVRIEMRLPADQLGSTAGRMGRRDSRVSVSFSPSRKRTITISGTYTAVPSTPLARDQYEAVIGAYVTAVQTAIDAAAKWELIEEPITEVDDTVDSTAGKGKVLRFVRVYEEIIFTQAGATSGVDNPSIVRQFFRATRRISNPGSIPRAGLFTFVDATYDCAVDKTLSTDLLGLWNNTIKPFMIQRVAALVPGVAALVEDRHSFDFDGNTIQAQLTFQGTTGVRDTIEGEIVVEDALETGSVVVPVFDRNQHAAVKYQGPARRTRTITKSFLSLALPPEQGVRPEDIVAPSKGTVTSFHRSAQPIEKGTSPGQSFTLFHITERTVIEFFDAVDGTTVPPAGEIPSASIFQIPDFQP